MSDDGWRRASTPDHPGTKGGRGQPSSGEPTGKGGREEPGKALSRQEEVRAKIIAAQAAREALAPPRPPARKVVRRPPDRGSGPGGKR